MILKVIGSSSKGNGYVLIEDIEILILECGFPFKAIKKAIDYNILKIKGCLLTHGHTDHFKYVREYLHAGIPVYTNEETKINIDTKAGDRLYSLTEFQPVHIGGFKVISLYVPHNGIPNYAYLIEHGEMGRLLFATDFEYIPYNFQKQQVQHFLIEANYDKHFIDQELPNYEHKLLGHASLATCLAAIKANLTPNLRNVIMCHLGGGSSSSEYFISEMQKIAGQDVHVACAKPDLVVELSKNPF